MLGVVDRTGRARMQQRLVADERGRRQARAAVRSLVEHLGVERVRYRAADAHVGERGLRVADAVVEEQRAAAVLQADEVLEAAVARLGDDGWLAQEPDLQVARLQ